MVNVLIFLAVGFEEIEATTIIDILRRCGIDVTIVGLFTNEVEGAHGIKIIPDKSIEDIDVKDFDAIVLPGGSPGYQNLRKDQRVINIIKEAHDHNKLIGAICAAPSVLSDAGILKGRNCTIYPGMENEIRKGKGNPKEDIVVIDKNIVTSRGPATTIPFSLKLAELLVGKEIAEKVRRATLADIVLK
jgi:4-methyl-5(b-hydroxyethyl)-thiazole monophosphate biosynthesis